MKILWFTWKDKKNPLGGGAELTTSEMGRLLAQDGHDLTFITSGFKNGKPFEEFDGYKVIRLGNRWTVYWKAFLYYKKNLAGKYDLVVDECNTLPFFCRFFVKEKNIFWIQQFAREIWFYQMFFPLNIVGYCIELLYLKLFKNSLTFTFAESTKKDLGQLGFKAQNIHILREACLMNIIDSEVAYKKYAEPTILFLSALREMKRPDHVIKAFEISKANIPNLKLKIIGGGSGKYYEHVLKLIRHSKYANDIEYLGKLGVSDPKKAEVLRQSHFICCPSVREGWGIIVVEAASQGTPAIVYNVNGLKDAVDYGKNGYICDENTPSGMAKMIFQGFQKNEDYESLRKNAVEFSKQINIHNSYAIFKKVLNLE